MNPRQGLRCPWRRPIRSPLFSQLSTRHLVLASSTFGILAAFLNRDTGDARNARSVVLRRVDRSRDRFSGLSKSIRCTKNHGVSLPNWLGETDAWSRPPYKRRTGCLDKSIFRLSMAHKSHDDFCFRNSESRNVLIGACYKSVRL